MSSVGFLPTTNIPRAHGALTRFWKHELGRRRLDAIFLSWPKLAYAHALGWEEMGTLVDVQDGWTTVDTLREFGRTCNVMVLRAGDAQYYANCSRAAWQLGEPSWITWQEGPVACEPVGPGLLISELPSAPLDFHTHGTFEDFWAAVDRERRFTWVVRVDAIGDLLLTLSYLHAFKKRHPHRRVGLIARDRYLPWLREIPWLDAVSGVDVLHWNDLTATAPADDGQSAWLMPMPGMLRIAGNRLLAERSGPRASAYPDSQTPCEYSPRRHVVNHRELLSLAFEGVQPELPVIVPPRSAGGPLWFSPYPGGDERLWPPDSWAAALEPLADHRLILQAPQAPLHQRWESEFLIHAARRRLRVERAQPTRTIFDLARVMSLARGWVGINSAPMHVAALLGLPAVALGLPWEVNEMWASPHLQIVTAETYARVLLNAPSMKGLEAFARDTRREDAWSDGLYVRPEEVAATLATSPLADQTVTR